MAERAIVRLGDPVLRTPAAPVSKEQLRSSELQRLIDDMLETVVEAAGVGLAAPQIGEPLQLFVYLAGESTLGEPQWEVVVNPALDPIPGELVYDWEGCLSIPDLRGLVPRHAAVRLRGLDREGAAIDREVTDFPARIVQHEFDHLHGVVFLDRMRDLQSLCFESEWERFVLGEDQDERSTVG
jgi:peptide deformylase